MSDSSVSPSNDSALESLEAPISVSVAVLGAPESKSMETVQSTLSSLELSTKESPHIDDDYLDGLSPSFGEVHYETVDMNAARAKFSSTSSKQTTEERVSPRRPPPTGLGGGAGIPAAGSITGSPVGRTAVSETKPVSLKPEDNPAFAEVKVCHKKTWYPLRDLICATKQNPGVFEGIDFSAKELLLNEEGFKTVFGVTYDEFSSKGKWVQSQEKKRVGLF